MKKTLAAIVLLSASSVAMATQQAIVGSWRINVHVPAGSLICSGGTDCDISAMATATSDRTVVQSAAMPNVSQGHGAWTKQKGDRFVVRSTYFRFNSSGQLIGSSETTTAMDIKKNATTANGQFTNQLYDLQGNNIGSFSGAATATRISPP